MYFSEVETITVKNYQVRRYQPDDFEIWNAFTSVAKNATFLFHRDFIEYHAHRFEDFSVLIFKEEKLLAVMPANRVETTVFSHQGLSYGGILVKDDIRIKEYVWVFKVLMQFLEANGIKTFEMKMLPKIYNQTLADEIEYVSFLMKSERFRADVYLVIDNQKKYKPNRNRKRALKIAAELEIEIREENDYSSFWNQILTPNLNNRFHVNPVHTVEEIHYLASKFPNNIKLFNAYQNKDLKAGVVVFLTKTTAHFQYSSGGDDRNDTAALDVLFDNIIQKYAHKRYVSFGCSSEENGLKLNEGLAYWKESFGATTTVQNFLRFNTTNYHLLEI